MSDVTNGMMPSYLRDLVTDEQMNGRMTAHCLICLSPIKTNRGDYAPYAITPPSITPQFSSADVSGGLLSSEVLYRWSAHQGARQAVNQTCCSSCPKLKPYNYLKSHFQNFINCASCADISCSVSHEWTVRSRESTWKKPEKKTRTPLTMYTTTNSTMNVNN